jgi:hypothetical protein
MSQAELLPEKVPQARIVSSVSRFTLADFTSKQKLLLDNLPKFWPQVNANNYTGHLIPYMSMNGFIFVKNDTSVALGMLVVRPFQTAPYVEAVFGFCDDDYKKNGASLLQLYREMIRWGKSLGATEFRPGHITNYAHGALKTALGAEQYGEIILDIPRD